MTHFSVIIPLYNKEFHIKRAIRSVFAQSNQDFELVVVNDGSTDKSVEAAQTVIDSRIRIISQENSGVSAARNRGVVESRADLVVFLDADDEWSPVFLQEILNLKDHYPDCGAFATAFQKINEKSEKEPFLPVCGYPVGWQGKIEDYFKILVKGAPFFSSSIAVKKNIMQAIGGFPVGIRQGEDVNTWLRLSLATDIAYLNLPLAVYHQDAQGRACVQSRTLLDSNGGYNHAEFLRDMIERGIVPSKRRQSAVELMTKYAFPLVRRYCSLGKKKQGISLLWKCRTTRVYRAKWIKEMMNTLLH